jgi:hypothetical protein
MKRTAFVAHMTNPARVFCVAGVIGLAAVLGDSIPFTTNIAKKNAAASVRQQVCR